VTLSTQIDLSENYLSVYHLSIKDNIRTCLCCIVDLLIVLFMPRSSVIFPSNSYCANQYNAVRDYQNETDFHCWMIRAACFGELRDQRKRCLASYTRLSKRRSLSRRRLQVKSRHGMDT